MWRLVASRRAALFAGSALLSGVVDAPPQPWIVLDTRVGDGQHVPNLAGGEPAAFSGNLYAYPRGDLRASGSGPTITRFHNGEWARVLWTSTSQSFQFWNSAVNAPTNYPPAMEVTVGFEAYSLTGATQVVRLGATGDLVNLNITTAPQPFERTITTSGGNFQTLGIFNDGAGNLPDIAIRNIQVRLGPGPLPPFEDARTWSLTRRVAFPGGLRFNADGSIDNMTGNGTNQAGGISLLTGPQLVEAASAADALTITQATFIWAVRLDEAGSNGVIMSTEANTDLGTSLTTLQMRVDTTGRLTCAPLNLGVAQITLEGAGWLLVWMRVKDAEQSVGINELQTHWEDDPFSPVKARLLLMLSGTTTASQFKGAFAGGRAYLKHLSDEELLTAIAETRAQLESEDVQFAVPEEVVCGFGDSRTFSAVGAGASFLSQQAIGYNFQGGTKRIWLRNVAVTGYRTEQIQALLTENNTTQTFPVGSGGVARRIVEIQAMGSRPIGFLGPTGVNNSEEVIADPVNFFNTRWLPLANQALAMFGAPNLIVSTELNANTSVAGVSYDSQRTILNGLIAAWASTNGVELCDLGALPFNDASNFSDPAKWYDPVHPAQAPHDEEMKPALTTSLQNIGV